MCRIAKSMRYDLSKRSSHKHKPNENYHHEVESLCQKSGCELPSAQTTFEMKETA